MWNISTSTTAGFTNYVTGATVAFMPLWATIIGVFLAFAIAGMLRYFLVKTMKK